MWAKLGEILVKSLIGAIPALITMISEKVVGPLIIKGKEASAKRKKRKAAKAKIKEHQNAKSKSESGNTFNRLP